MMNRPASRKGNLILVVLLLQVVFIPFAHAINTNAEIEFINGSTQEVDLDSCSWKIVTLRCDAGDRISGELTLTNNGDLFIGDQTKYDNWLLDGIDFMILNATNYELWINDQSVNYLYERKNVFELSWSVDVPSAGIWYIIFNNDSIFMKQVVFNIHHISQSSFIQTTIVATFVCLSALLALIYTFRKKK